MKSRVPLIVALLCGACGDAPTSPSTSQGSILQPPAGPTSNMRGEVMDTTNTPIAGAQVQVLTGPRAGTVALTDENGQFVMPWTASDSATVRVSKDGFHPHQRPVPARVAGLRFDLEAIDTPIIVAGYYDMTLTAANECTQLPGVARQRTHRSQVYPDGGGGRFAVSVVDGDFPYSPVFRSEVRGAPPRTLRVQIASEPYAKGLVERLGPEMFLEITGSVDLPLGAQSAATFEGTFAFCAAPASSNDVPYRCPIQPVTCRSANHRLAWMRE